MLRSKNYAWKFVSSSLHMIVMRTMFIVTEYNSVEKETSLVTQTRNKRYRISFLHKIQGSRNLTTFIKRNTKVSYLTEKSVLGPITLNEIFYKIIEQSFKFFFFF
jgi:hypothetical protein